MYLRKNKKIRQEVSIDQALSYDGDGNELHLEDIIGTDKDLVSKNIEEKNDKSLMIKEILNLKPRDRDIMVLRYGLLGNDEFTQKEVAEKLGISQSYISRIEKKVIKKLKCLVSA
jgi:RNA polymerase sporulation-specific sigma factor